MHILDTTGVEVALETGTYECSGVVADDDGRLWRGYKLATLRTLLDTAGIITAVAVGPVHRHDHVLCAPLLSESSVLRAGDLLVMDRGLLDGATISDLKRRREVDVIVPLRSDMHSYQAAVKLAERANQWQPHPTRSEQQIAFVPGVEHVWDECQVRLNACVIRFYNKKSERSITSS